jgi:hypothetical protein
MITITFIVGFVAGWIVHNYLDTIKDFIKNLL